MRPFLIAICALILFANSANAATPKNQEEWLFSSITNDIAQMLLYASAKKNGHTFAPDQMECHAEQIDQSKQTYSVSIKSPELPSEFKREIKLEKCIYETPAYAKFAGDLMTELKLSPESGSFVPSTDVVRRLSDNSMGALYEENSAISSALNEHPLNAELQEEAALLFSTFNLLDMSCSFSDSRFGVSRAAAHLAIASALRGNSPPTYCGKLAETAQFCQSSRDTEATEHAEALFKDAKSNYEKSWARCMYIMGTNDPRNFDVDNFTPVEEYQYLMRVSFFESPQQVVEYLHKQHRTSTIGWMRLVNNGPVSVETGHEYTTGLLSAELADYAKDLQLWNHKVWTYPTSIGPDINQQPSPCLYDGKLQVISWPDLAFWHQRQILSAFAATHYFYSQMYGVKEDADRIAAGGKHLLGSLTLYPFVTELIVGSDIKADIDGSLQVISKSPQLVPGSIWFSMCRADKSGRFMPVSKAWFGGLPLFGTAYDFWGYSDVMKSSKLDLATTTKLRALAIFNRDVCEKYVELKYGHHPTGDQWAEGYGKMLEYDRTARWRTVYGDISNPDKYIPGMAKLAKIDSRDYYLDLADYCWFFGRPVDTFKYYQLGMNSDANDIGKANRARWYVKYLYEHGDKAAAEKWANFAAEVYSAGGLKTRAWLYEAEGKLADAESWYRKEEERYDDHMLIDAFYIRHQSDPKYAAQAKAVVLKYFGKAGMVKTETLTGSTAPIDGARLKDTGFMGQNVGLKDGYVVVAVNGYRVHNAKQGEMMQQVGNNFSERAVYWNGHGYKSYQKPRIYAAIASFEDYKPTPAKNK